MESRHACVVVACIALWGDSVLAWQGRESPRPPARVDRLKAWLTAVEQHQPGTADNAVIEVRTWDRATLRLVWIDLGTVISVIREPEAGIFFEPVPPQPFIPPSRQPATLGQPNRVQRPRQILYSHDELTAVREIAREVTARGGENRVLKRGAMLHADIAMLAPVSDGAPTGFQPAGPQRITLYVSDGQQSGLDDSASHWEMGRRLLNGLRPEGSRAIKADPAADVTARTWYLAAASYMQSIEQLDPWHAERSMQLFPMDSDILFFAACLHETLSSPHFQTAMQVAELPRDVFFDIQSEGAELRTAERLFRRSLERNPMRIEARIRLGRVLGRRDRHEDAERELRQAVGATDNRLLLYYGNMFLGAEVEALGRPAEAREAYERAAALYPLAQSPRLALSVLATRVGDRAGALQAIDTLLRRDRVDESDDPWWSYFTAQGRGTDALLADLHRRLESEERR